MRHAEALGTVYDMEQLVSIYHPSFTAFKGTAAVPGTGVYCGEGLILLDLYYPYSRILPALGSLALAT